MASKITTSHAAGPTASGAPMTGGSANSSAHGAPGAPGGMTPAQAAQAAQLALRHWMSLVDAQAAKYYGISIAVLIGLFILFHVSRTFMHLQGRRGTVGRMIASPFRLFRSLTLQKIPKFSSLGHLCLIVTWLALNFLFAFWHMHLGGIYGASFISKRCGWLAMVNLGLLFLLAMKNSPISYLTGYSHERLNVLHRWVGRVCVIEATIHVLLLMMLQTPTYTAGLVSWCFFVFLFLNSFAFVRRRSYEWFYVVHVASFIAAVVALAFHKMETYGAVVYLVGAFWLFDRLVRLFRYFYYSSGTEATLLPLPGDAVKVILNRKATFQPGSHGFLSVPSVKLLQSHPFTISSSTDLEFIIRAQRGFTRKLYEKALKNPGMKIKANFDGPYGAVPDFRRMNRVVLFAGGSGGSFTFPIAIDIARNVKRCCVEQMEFVWVIREKENAEWFANELEELRQCPIINLRIFVTKAPSDLIATHPESPSNNPTSNELTLQLPFHRNIEAILETDDRSTSASDSPISPVSATSLALPEKALDLLDTKSVVSAHPLKVKGSSSNESNLASHIVKGRPDMHNIVREALRDATADDLVMVGACGPTALMRGARNAVATSIKVGGPSISLHCEQFGWG